MSHDPDLARLESRNPSRLANVLGQVADPVGMVVLTLIVTCWKATAGPLQAALWFLAATVFMAMIPAAVLALLLRRGHIAERQVPRRRERYLPYAATMTSVTFGVVLLYALHAPALLLRVVDGMFLGILAMAALNVLTKASLHSGVVAGSVMLWGYLVGPAAWVVGGVLWYAVAWSRIRSGRHSVGQVLLGGVTGSAAAAAALWGLR